MTGLPNRIELAGTAMVACQGHDFLRDSGLTSTPDSPRSMIAGSPDRRIAGSPDRRIAMRTGALCVAALALALSACGGGGGSGTRSEVDRFRSDPRIVRAAGLIEQADTLLHSHSHYTVSSGRIERHTETWACVGTRCTSDGGAEVRPEDLFPEPDKVTPGARGGFDTAAFTFSQQVSNPLPGGAPSARLERTHYGFWGEHGYAALVLGRAPLTGTPDGSPATGALEVMEAFALGDASGTNPVGTGSATWTGIAEAARKGSLQRLQGTATVTVPDLSRPRIGVAIDVPGHNIGAPGWSDIALTGGRFATGRAGTDYLAGSLNGPAHQEAWGVFDTTGYVGAFGARRQR